MTDDDRVDLLTVVEDSDGRFHLQTWTTHSADATEIRAWCTDAFDVETHDVWTFPMGLLDYESLCLDCYYRKRDASRQRFAPFRDPEADR